MSSVVDEAPGQRGREALARHAWREAFEVMTEADHAGDLGPDDLEVLAQSTWWVGQRDAASEAWERAYTLHARSGDKVAAATAALAGTRPLTGPRSVTLKGFAEPVEVVSVPW